MISVNFTSDVENVVATEHLYQWDNGQKLSISGVGTTADIHFANKKSEKALVVTPTITSGTMVAFIPNSLLAEPYPILAYVYVPSDNGARTLKTVTIAVEARKQPSDFVLDEDEGITTLESISARVNEMIQSATNQINTAVSNIQTDYTNFKNTIQDELDEMKANTTIPNADTLDGFHANEIASNPNLLLNPWFGNGVINTGGKTQWTSGETVNKWISYNAKVKLESNHISIEAPNATTICSLRQTVISGKNLGGKTVTISVDVDILNAGSRLNLQLKYNNTWSTDNTHTNVGRQTLLNVVKLPDTITTDIDIAIMIQTPTVSGVIGKIKVYSVKLEIGGIATNFVPPNPAEELLKINAIDGTIHAKTANTATTANSVNGVTFLVGTATPQVTDPSAEGYVPEGAWYGQYE